MIKAINAGPGFPGVSQAIFASDSDYLFITGQCPTDDAGEIVRESFEAQVEAVYRNLKLTLAAAGADLKALVKCTVWVTTTKPEDIATFKKVRARHVNADCPPASMLVTVPELYDPAVLIEIDGIAAIPRQ